MVKKINKFSSLIFLTLLIFLVSCGSKLQNPRCTNDNECLPLSNNARCVEGICQLVSNTQVSDEITGNIEGSDLSDLDVSEFDDLDDNLDLSDL